jgi:hypothetical protein
MFCPECSAEYRAGYTRCSDCDVALVSALPPEEMDTDHGSEVVTVFVTRDIVEAETVKELLEANGIEVHVNGESSPLPGVPGEVRLIVTADDADRANRAIEEFSLEEDQGDDAEEDLNNVVPFPAPDRRTG